MNYGSVCSGIEAASVAWEPLGWTPAWFAEVEPFPRAVLAHHWPAVPNLGDLTDDRFTENARALGAIDLLVGGTPCQSFSVAGLRGGLDDDRGNLALHFCRIADALQPRWVVWENVPGVLSSNGGRDFGAILGALAECGYHLAWRILDAQYFGVPQRRRRVFVVGHLGDWRPAAAVLFERGQDKVDTAARKIGTTEIARTLKGGAYAGKSDADPVIIDDQGCPRFATSTEWARLQGFPDDHCRIPWRGKPAAECPDGPQYRAYGNSMAVNVMRWIGERIQQLEAVL